MRFNCSTKCGNVDKSMYVKCLTKCLKNFSSALILHSMHNATENSTGRYVTPTSYDYDYDYRVLSFEIVQTEQGCHLQLYIRLLGMASYVCYMFCLHSKVEMMFFPIGFSLFSFATICFGANPNPNPNPSAPYQCCTILLHAMVELLVFLCQLKFYKLWLNIF